MRNTYPDLMMKLLQEIKKFYIFFPDFSSMNRLICVYMQATFLVAEKADRFLLGPASHFVADKEPLKRFFLSAFERNVHLLQS